MSCFLVSATVPVYTYSRRVEGFTVDTDFMETLPPKNSESARECRNISKETWSTAYIFEPDSGTCFLSDELAIEWDQSTMIPYTDQATTNTAPLFESCQSYESPAVNSELVQMAQLGSLYMTFIYCNQIR